MAEGIPGGKDGAWGAGGVLSIGSDKVFAHSESPSKKVIVAVVPAPAAVPVAKPASTLAMLHSPALPALPGRRFFLSFCTNDSSLK